MAKARWNVTPARRAHRRSRPDHPGRHGRLGQGRRRQVVGHGQPGRRAGRPRADRRRARRRHLGLLRPPHARRRRPARRPRARRPQDDGAASSGASATASCEVVSMGFLVEDEETALMWRGLMLNRGVQHFLQDVALGRRPRLPADRHAARHRRRADGRGQAAAPRRGDHRHDARRSPPRRWRPGRSTWPARATCGSPASSRT